MLTVLKEKKCTDFCKKYINIHPVVTKTVTVTSCGKANPNCLTVTQTSVVPVTQDVTNTVEAETPTGKYCPRERRLISQFCMMC